MGELTKLKAVQIFTPAKYPEYTFVPRIGREYENLVRNAFRTPNLVVSVSGPSKSGKSVLIQQGAGSDNLIHIHGAQVRAAEDVWKLVMRWMDTPSTIQTENSLSPSRHKEFSGSINVGSKSLVGFELCGKSTTEIKSSESSSLIINISGIDAVAKEIAHSEYVVFIDDFHYILPLEVQQDVSRHIKAAAERGIKICIASVTHRSDDAVRRNPELRGRVQTIDIEYWTEDELLQIGVVGFQLLNVCVSKMELNRLAREACGSPQLMQSLCLQTCFRFDIHETQSQQKEISIDNDALRKILEITSSQADYSTMVENMHQGPKQRGTERKEFSFRDGTRGDVYRAVLLALRQDPPAMTHPYAQLLQRVEDVCVGESPVGSSVSQACEQIDKIAEKLGIAPDGSGAKPIELDQSVDVQPLHIVDPHFLFYLRASSKLDELGKR